jgi:glycerol uptake facilitator-like aquaporin
MSKEFTFESVVDKLSTNQKRFVAELIGTFIVVVLATGSVVINAKLDGIPISTSKETRFIAGFMAMMPV